MRAVGQGSEMEPKRVDAGYGASWVGDGWRAFAASPGMWIVLVIVFVLVLVALQLVPLVGPLAAQLITPALSGGLLLAARDSLAGKPLDVGQLFQPLTDEETRAPMLVLGVLFLVAGLVAMAAAAAVFMSTAGVTMWQHHGAMMTGDPMAIGAGAWLQMGFGITLAFLVGFALWSVVLVLFYYAIPLVLFAGMKPGQSISVGLRGLGRNVLPLFVFSVIWLLLSIVATVPLGLGWLVLLPMTYGSWYASYRDVFEAGDEPTGKGPAPA